MHLNSLFRITGVSLLLAVLTPTTSATAATTASPAFCTATTTLFASPAFVAQHWPLVASTRVSQAAVLQTVQELNNYNPSVFTSMAKSAPSKAIATALTSIGRSATSELTLVSDVWYASIPSTKRAATLQRSITLGQNVRHQLARLVAPLVHDCATFSATNLVNIFALTLTMRAAEQGFANGGVPNAFTFATAQKNESHQVLVEQLVLRGPTSSVAKFRVATINGYITVCTSIPGAAGVVSKVVHC